MKSSIVKTAAGFFAVAAVVAAAGPATAAGGDSGAERIASTNLRGKFEVPGPGDPDGKGQFSAVITNTQLCYSLSSRKIGGATAAHIHFGDPTVAGPITVQLLTPNRNGVSDCIMPVPDADDDETTLSETELNDIRDSLELYYVNVHSAEFPSGAVRGQLG